jgi:glycosyltransferase involved in cell wall biosynthesis
MSSKPRILALFGVRVIFGNERENIEVLAALIDQGCEVLCLVPHEKWSSHICDALSARGIKWMKVPYVDGWLKGWRTRAIIRNPFVLLIANWRLFQISRQFKPTHIHCFNQFSFLNFCLMLLLLDHPMVYRSGDKPVVHNIFWRQVWRLVVARTSMFVAVSKFIANELMGAGVPAERVSVVYGLPPRRTVTSSNSEELFQQGPDESVRDIVFVGRITGSKGVHVLVDAFRIVARNFPDARLILIGPISESSFDEWARQLRGSIENDDVLRSRVLFTGHVENVPAILRDREVLVVPSIAEEGAPLVVLEAKEASLPAIVFPSGGLVEMIEDNIDGIICKEKSVDALVDALEYYLKNSGTSSRHGMAARKSLERFGRKDFAERFLEIYCRAG